MAKKLNNKIYKVCITAEIFEELNKTKLTFKLSPTISYEQMRAILTEAALALDYIESKGIDPLKNIKTE